MIRTLVVEDELWERKGILHMIDWEAHGMAFVAEAENGEEALHVLASEQIDLVLTDMSMPIVDGVAFLKDKNVFGYECEIIVISGHTDYDYMKQAISSNVFEYILKPYGKKELNDVLHRVCEKIRSKEREREAKREIEDMINTSRPLLLENLLNALIERSPHEKHQTALAELQKLGIALKQDYYRIIVLSIGNGEVSGGPVTGPMLRELMINLDKIPCTARSRLIFRSANNHNEIIVLFEDHKELGYLSNALFREFSMLAATPMNEGRKLTIHAGIGECVLGTDNISESYRKALMASKYEELSHAYLPVFYTDIKDLPEDVVPLLSADDRRLIKEMASLNTAELPEFITNRFKRIKANKYCRISDIQKDVVELVVIFEECAHSLEMSSQILNRNLLNEINSMNTITALQRWSEELARRFSDEIMNRHKKGLADNVVDQIIHYLEENYMEEIKLISLAQRYYINHIYLSRLFRNQTGQNFIDYLTRIRMMKAKDLLQDGKLKVKDVAKMVGYDNPFYFTKRFRKYFNYSPSDS